MERERNGETVRIARIIRMERERNGVNGTDWTDYTDGKEFRSTIIDNYQHFFSLL